MRRIATIFGVVLFLVTPLRAKEASEIRLALKKLTVVGSALHVGAHPDDENTALLAWLANEKLVRTGYLSMTRGDGGQNLLGDEKGELLGVIRTQELLAARRIDGAEQFFTRALDFGFTKSPVETLNIWGHDAILADTVWIIREFQPDVIITRFPTTGEGGHGHHTASAILAGEAFTAAADPTKFPEQLKYVKPWQAKRLVWNRFGAGFTQPKPEDIAGDIKIDLGTYNPLLGRAYTEIAAQSRSMHKSQGFGVAERRGSAVNYFHVLAGDPAPNDLFDGVDTTWSRFPGGDAVGALLQQAYDTFDENNPQKSIPVLMRALEQLTKLGASTLTPQQSAWLDVKQQDIGEAIKACAGLAIDVSAGDSYVVPGGQVPVTVTVVNRSDYPFTLSAVASPLANPSKAPGVKLANNVPVKTEITIRVPLDQPDSQPYWLANPPTQGRFNVTDQRLIGLAENKPSIPITVSFDDGLHLQPLIFTVPALFRWTDAVRGEQVRRIDVGPEVTANMGSGVYLFPEPGKARPVTIWLKNYTEVPMASVRLLTPDPRQWHVDPVSVVVNFTGKNDEKRVTFMVTPPMRETIGQIAAQVELPGGKKITVGLNDIAYPHIPAQRVFGDAMSKLVRVDVKKIGQHIGYIMGAGDDVPGALRQIGYEVTLLTDDDLERGDFAKYDAIVTGVRAYNARKAMKLAHPKLMKYVENGGTLVVQYNSLSPQPLLVDPPGPYPFKVTGDRVTVEEAPVKFLDPKHPLLNVPNKITENDFADWVQERGLYFTENWDPRYTTILATNDPGEPERAGGELYTRYGKGVFIYTGYAWFRQLPAGVPGSYKLFANLVSARGETRAKK